MGRLLRKCEELEKAAAEAGMEATAAGRKRKVYSEGSEISGSSIQLKTRRLADVAVGNSASPASSGSLSCDEALASCCSSNGSSELAKQTSKFVDLEDNEGTEEFLATSAGDSLDCGVRRETTPSREAQAESGELESTARPGEPNPRGLSPPVKMPSEAELEEFFAAAEKSLQQKFIDKYNYDIVKDQPLEGRYEWAQVQLRPE